MLLRASGGLLISLLGLLLVDPAWSGEGQRDLDRALELKIQAQNLKQLAEVAALCESAIKKGLDADNEEFARQLLTGTLYQRSRQLCEPIFSRTGRDDRWRLLRSAALQDLEKIVEYDPQYGEAHLLIAELQLLPGGDRGKAQKAIQAILDSSAIDKPVKAQALLLRGRMDGAEPNRLAALNKAIELDPQNTDALRARALIHLQQGRSEEAMADFERLLQKDPTNVAVRLAVVQALISLEKYDEALQQVNTLLEQQPDSGARALRAELLARKGQVDEAIADLGEVLQDEPGDLPARLLRAQLYFQQQKDELAAADLRTLLKARPDLPQAVALQSLVTATRGDLDAAIRLMRRLVEQEPQETTWQLQLALLYNLAKQPDKSIEVYTSVLEAIPDQADARRGRADMLLAIGKHQEAIQDYEMALKAMPEDPELLNNFAWVLATSPDDALRDGKRAAKLARQACELTEHQKAHILSTLAAALAETGDFDAALKWATKAVELGDPTIRDQLEAEKESYQEQKPWRERKQPPAPGAKKPATDSQPE